MMEAVRRRFKISATTFHINSTRPIPRYSVFLLVISTTACHMAHYASFPSRNADWTRFTTIVQLYASVSDCASKVLPFSVLPALSVVVASFSAFSFYDFRAIAIHLFRCSALIPDSPPER